MVRTVQAARYVLPLREGSSVPALVEGDDLGLYVVKLRGAGQGPKALVAELLSGELARAAGLTVPEIVLVELDRAIAASEPDPELCRPLEGSVGTNLGLDYLPGSVTVDPVAGLRPDETTASRIALFDALVANVDRTAKNPNLLGWHGQVWLIDHGASLYFHHGWSRKDRLEGSADPFPEIQQHVLLPWATQLDASAAHLAAALTEPVIASVVAAIPELWLRTDDGFADADAHRAAYAAWLRRRVANIPIVLEEAKRARSLAV